MVVEFVEFPRDLLVACIIVGHEVHFFPMRDVWVAYAFDEHPLWLKFENVRHYLRTETLIKSSVFPKVLLRLEEWENRDCVTAVKLIMVIGSFTRFEFLDSLPISF